MRLSRGVWLGAILVVVAGLTVWTRIGPQFHRRSPAPNSSAPAIPAPVIPDRSVTSPLNQPGGGAAPDGAYEIYSALYREPQGEPLAFAEDSVTDIPQVDGSCLRPSTPGEREMTEAFEAANQQSHRWEQRFTIPGGYRLMPRSEASEAQSCFDKQGQADPRCESYKQLRHVRFLGVPGFDRLHARALVSIVRMCGESCGSGGIFMVEKTGGTWRRAEVTDFTRECSWMYQR